MASTISLDDWFQDYSHRMATHPLFAESLDTHMFEQIRLVTEWMLNVNSYYPLLVHPREELRAYLLQFAEVTLRSLPTTDECITATELNIVRQAKQELKRTLKRLRVKSE